MVVIRILFMGGHELGKIALESLIKSNKNIIGVVITDTTDEWYKGVDEVAQKHSILVFKEKNINNTDFVVTVRKMSPELIVVVNFDQILKEEIISIPIKGCINTHASLLPKYRGRAPLNWAIINGEKETGVTVHYINKGIDTGDIIVQVSIDIEENDYIEDILGKVKKVYSYIVKDSVEKIIKGTVVPIKQDISSGCYCSKRTPKDGQINWDKPAIQIYNLIRATSEPYPGSYTYYNGFKVIIWKAELAEQDQKHREYKNGKVLEVRDNHILVKSVGNNLKITKYDIISDKNQFVRIRENESFNFKDDIND
ncbi:MAG: methionyl-tRNA formyltransferase [Clostridia bacterium]|nr:methionyl-tRNA formyltransferase [Clostridia bacterium]